MNKKYLFSLWLFILTLSLTGCNLSQSTPSNTSSGSTPKPGEAFATSATPTISPTATPLPEAHILQGDMALLQSDSDLAINEYRTAALASEDIEIQAAAVLGTAKAYFEKSEYDQTITTIQSLINEHPANQSLPNGYYFLAAAYEKKQMYSQAAEAYGKFIELKPGILDDLIYALQAEAYMNAGMYPEAVQAYQNVLSASTSDKGQYLIKIGQAYAAQSDSSKAVDFYLQAYEATSDDYVKAQANLLCGQTYLELGFPEQAYARFQDSVTNYWKSYDAYSGLVALVNDNQPVDELQRGLVDYYAGQYGYAAEAFSRYTYLNPNHDGTPHYYRGLALMASDDYQGAIAEWQTLIKDHPDDSYLSDAYQEIAYTQWAYLEQFDTAAQTLKNYVSLNPNAADAADVLFSAGRILERGNRLTPAAQTWEGMTDQYPSADSSARGLFLAGITYYRLGNYEQAKLNFQRNFALGISPSEQSAALLWIGKSQQALGDSASAATSWQQAALLDPTGYYSERAGELANSEPPFHTPDVVDLGMDLPTEKKRAETWLVTTFGLPADTNFDGVEGITDNPHYLRGMALWEINHYQEAREEFEAFREVIQDDALLTYRFMNVMLNIGAYRPAIFAARQILDLANLDDQGTLTAPQYFNMIRFGVYYKNIVVDEANETGFSSLFILSVIRQESFFEPFIGSSAGARGLMQIMPATGAELAKQYAWPENYTDEDLYNATVNVRLGIKYLATQRDYFDGDIYKALAAYNAGPGNAQIWGDLVGNDPDLYLEVIRYEETQNYIRNISEYMNLYRLVYERK